MVSDWWNKQIAWPFPSSALHTEMVIQPNAKEKAGPTIISNIKNPTKKI